MSHPFISKNETLKVVEYNREKLLHVCIDEDGCSRRVDLYVDCCHNLPHPEDLVGKTVTITGSQAYVEIGCGAKIVDNGEQP